MHTYPVSILPLILFTPLLGRGGSGSLFSFFFFFLSKFDRMQSHTGLMYY
jgi:hypothetical protein